MADGERVVSAMECVTLVVLGHMQQISDGCPLPPPKGLCPPPKKGLCPQTRSPQDPEVDDSCPKFRNGY